MVMHSLDILTVFSTSALSRMVYCSISASDIVYVRLRPTSPAFKPAIMTTISIELKKKTRSFLYLIIVNQKKSDKY